jgi:hypothetical protein
MLTALPIVLACAGFQPCPDVPLTAAGSPRTSSPSAIIAEAPATLRHRTAARSLAFDNMTLPRTKELSRASSAQPPLRMPVMGQRRGGGMWISNVMGAAVGVLAGGYAGGMMGALFGEGDDALGTMAVGMGLGAAVGGVLGWKLLK